MFSNMMIYYYTFIFKLVKLLSIIVFLKRKRKHTLFWKKNIQIKKEYWAILVETTTKLNQDLQRDVYCSAFTYVTCTRLLTYLTFSLSPFTSRIFTSASSKAAHISLSIPFKTCNDHATEYICFKYVFFSSI